MFLRIRDIVIQWPYGVGQFRADEPQLSISDDPHDGELDSYASLTPPVFVYRVLPVTPPEYDTSQYNLLEVTPTRGEDGKWYQSWKLQEKEPVPVTSTSDWRVFKESALASPALKQVMSEAFVSDPVAASALAPALLNAEHSGSADFAAAWRTIGASVEIPGEVLHGFSGLAQQCNLPVDFVQALDIPPPAEKVGQQWVGPSGTLWRVAQATGEDGQFLPDNPLTPPRESLRWVVAREN